MQTTSNNQVALITILPIVISVMSFLISSYIALRSWWIERFNLDFEMIKWFGTNYGGHPFFIWLYITNSSKLPCSVLEVKLYNKRNDHIYVGSGTGNKKLIATSKKNENEPINTYSLDYPVRIEPYGSVGGYFHVISKAGFYAFEEDTIKITVRTSRGSFTKNIFMDRGRNIFRIIQHRDPSIKKNLILDQMDQLSIT